MHVLAYKLLHVSTAYLQEYYRKNIMPVVKSAIGCFKFAVDQFSSNKRYSEWP